MNKINTIVKIVTALAAAIGAIFVIATYGDKIVQWAKKFISCTENTCAEATEKDFDEDYEYEAPAEEAVSSEEAPVAEEAPAEPAPEEAPVSEAEATPVADEADFEG